jgi:hypothetical protein
MNGDRRRRWITRICRIGFAGGLLSAALAIGTGSAGAGAVGVRFGYADVSDDLFTGSGDLGGTNLVGLQFALGLGPWLEIEAAGEYVQEEFRFTEGLFDGVEAAGKGEYEDMGMFLTARLNVLSVPLLPIQGYAGGGVNVHWIDLAVDAAPVAGGGRQDDPNDLEDAIEKVAGDSSEAGWHAVIGLRFAPMGLPLSAFLEGRYLTGFGDDLPESKSVYVGVNLSL